MDEEDLEDEEEHQTWVEALTQELAADDDAPEEDPDYEVGEVSHIQNEIAVSCSLPKGRIKYSNWQNKLASLWKQ